MSSFPVLSPETFIEQAVNSPNANYTLPTIPEICRTVPSVYIFSVCPHTIVEGLYVIPACPSGQRVSKPLVIPGLIPHIYDRGEKEKGLLLIDGKRVAADLVGLLGGDTQLSEYTTNHEWRGLFISENPNPSEEAIDKARAKRTQYLEYLVDHGTNLRATEPQAKLQPFHYAAARELNVKTDWATKAQSQLVCPYCGASVPETAAKCPTCREIINPELYRALRAQLHVEETQPEAKMEAPKPNRK